MRAASLAMLAVAASAGQRPSRSLRIPPRAESIDAALRLEWGIPKPHRAYHFAKRLEKRDKRRVRMARKRRRGWL
jgi:hypothetical protein